MFSFWKLRHLDQKERLLRVLSDGLWHTNMELGHRVCLRYGDAIFRARKSGETIEVLQLKRGLFIYRLTSIK